MTWFRHLPHNQGNKGVSAYPWFTQWESPLRIEAARALVEHFDDERVAHWSVCEQIILDAMARKERAQTTTTPAAQGRLL